MTERTAGTALPAAGAAAVFAAVSLAAAARACRCPIASAEGGHGPGRRHRLARPHAHAPAGGRPTHKCPNPPNCN